MAKTNPGFITELATSPKMKTLIMGVTKQVADKARPTAPSATGAYRSGIVVTSVIRKTRIVGLVKATDPKSMLIESKTGNLARALKGLKRGRW